MAPSIMLLLPALFFSLVLQMVPSSHCIVDPTSTTLAISQATGTVCGITAGSHWRSIQCTQFQDSAELNSSFLINPILSFDSISGGHNFICSLRSGDDSFFCWERIRQRIKRVYSGPMVLSGISVGARHVAAIDGDRLMILWWRYGCNRHARSCRKFPKSVDGEYHSLTSGDVFTCAINRTHIVNCWGPRAELIQRSFAGVQIRSLTAGGGRMCGLNMTGHVICTGKKSNVPSAEAFEFTSLAIGGSHTCAIRRINGIAVCWGRYGSYFPMGSTGFEFLVAGGNLTCGLTTINFSVACWGLNGRNQSAVTLSMPKILPGPCVPDATFCSCGVYPDSGNLCGGSGVICKRSDYCPAIIETPQASSQGKGWFFYAIFGIVFAIFGIGINVCRKWLKVLPFRYCRICLGQEEDQCIPTELTIPAMDNVKVFSFNELNTATNNFSKEARLGYGESGIVYRGQLSDGQLVAVKRYYTKNLDWKPVFKAELETLATSRHVNVVSLIGYCTENNEALCVTEFMRNKDLHMHIRPRYRRLNTPLFCSWKLRVKVLLGAARGIEYLHEYAEPRIIHRDINPTNILLDENWVAKISDFGLAVIQPEPGHDHVVVEAVVGTAGYRDPDFNPNDPCARARRDVYSFGVVMLEMVTGQLAINTGEDTQLAPFAASKITTGNLMEVLDKRLALPEGREMEAIEKVAQLAVECTISGLERPNMSRVVTDLVRAVALFVQLN